MLNKIKKLIAVDLDGTLLNDNRRVSFTTARIMKKLNRKGYMVVLASGRPWRSIKSVYKQCGCYGPVISYNGSYVFHPKDPSFKPFLKTFELSTIKKIYNDCKDVTTSFMCESLDTVYVNKKDKYLKKYFWYKGMKLKEGNIDEILKENPVTCIILRPSKEDTLIDKACSNFEPTLLRHWTNSCYAELYIDKVDKGSALTYLIKKLGMKKEDVYAFGDAGNDYCMLEVAGNPFAMKNTKSEELKKAFPITKFTNHENGVALTLIDLLKD